MNKVIHQENSKPLILIVDDIPENLQILGILLEKNGYALNYASNGMAALKAVDDSLPDVILLDVLMPGMNGFDVCKVLKNQPDTKEIPIIFLTAKTGTDDIIKGFDLGAVDYIMKPFDVKEVLVRVRNHVDLKMMRDANQKFIDELRDANENLSRTEKELSLLNITKDKFISIVAHDLKSPFQGFLGLSELLLTDLSDLSKEDIREIAFALNKSAKQLFELLENLLTWSVVQMGQLQIEKSPIDISYLIETNFSGYSELAARKNIRLINKVPKDSMIFTDRNIINTVIRNLVSNGIKFSRSDGEVSASFLSEDNYSKIIISDKGVGMDAIEIEKLFQYEERFSRDGTGEEHGTGLGLLLSKELLERCNGKIQIKSLLGEGSTFEILLPNE